MDTKKCNPYHPTPPKILITQAFQVGTDLAYIRDKTGIKNKSEKGKKTMRVYDITTQDREPVRVLVVAPTVDEAKQIVRDQGHTVN